MSTQTATPRTAIVTGASSGIGLEFCHRLAEQGYTLVMVSNEQEPLLRESSSLSRSYGVKTYTLCLDLTAPDADRTLAQFMDDNGLQEEILVNNAGIFSFRPVVDTPERKVLCFIDLHVRAVTLLSRTFAERMRRRHHGYILNMASMACWTPMPGIALYSATKAYIRAFSRALHYELRDDGVNVMVACPGGIATDLFGLPPKLMKLALALRAVQTPRKFTHNALKRLLKGKMQYVNGLINRIGIVFVGMTPTHGRMLIKHKMLDKGIVR